MFLFSTENCIQDIQRFVSYSKLQFSIQECLLHFLLICLYSAIFFKQSVINNESKLMYQFNLYYYLPFTKSLIFKLDKDLGQWAPISRAQTAFNRRMKMHRIYFPCYKKVLKLFFRIMQTKIIMSSADKSVYFPENEVCYPMNFTEK